MVLSPWRGAAPVSNCTSNTRRCGRNGCRQVSGNIKALYADFNTKVSKGQLVALKLFPGMTANVRILTNTAKDTLKVFGGRLTAQPRIALMK